MSSAADIQQLMSMLQDVQILISNVQIKIDTLRAESGHAAETVREVEYLFMRITSMLQRLGLPEQVSAAITRVQQLILVVRTLHSAMIFMERGTAYGWILGLISTIGASLTAAQMTSEVMGEVQGH